MRTEREGERESSVSVGRMGRGEGAEGTLLRRMAMPAPTKVFSCRFPGEEQYEVVCKIGKGSYGTVVKARCRGTGEEVAIKHIDRVFADPADAVRTIRELRFLRMLKHPAIVVVETVLHPANPARFDDIFIVTELLDSDLSQLIRRRETITPAQKRWLAYQLLEGLAYLFHSTLACVSCPSHGGVTLTQRTRVPEQVHPRGQHLPPRLEAGKPPGVGS